MLILITPPSFSLVVGISLRKCLGINAVTGLEEEVDFHLEERIFVLDAVKGRVFNEGVLCLGNFDERSRRENVDLISGIESNGCFEVVRSGNLKPSVMFSFGEREELRW